MFDKVLVANRGEIACRIIRSCRKLGIQTVAIYSEPDERALHVQCADEAICVVSYFQIMEIYCVKWIFLLKSFQGPAPSSQSYLSISNIINAAKSMRVNAIHPGYGFLSENYHFVEELSANQITFIGPNAKAMRAMGDKIESKKIASKAGVNVIPGWIGEITDENHLLRIGINLFLLNF